MYIIAGLGNPGAQYAGTRHNTGFMVLDAFAKASNIHFEDKRYGFVAETTLKGRKIILLKPTTFMNLSGNAVRYWLNQEKIDRINFLARKSRTDGLTDAEKEEQLALRQEYVAAFRQSLTSQLDHTWVVDEKGKKRRLERRPGARKNRTSSVQNDQVPLRPKIGKNREESAD